MQNIKSKEIEIVSIGTLIPHPKNMNVHGDDQIERLCKIIEYQGFRNPLIVQSGTNLIVAGHGRLLAALKMGLQKVPIIYQEFDNEAQLYAFMVADNSIANWSSLDLKSITTEMAKLPDFDLELLGIKEFDIIDIPKLEDDDDKPKDESNKKFILQVELPNDMELRDLYDDLLSKGYLVKEL